VHTHCVAVCEFRPGEISLCVRVDHHVALRAQLVSVLIRESIRPLEEVGAVDTAFHVIFNAFAALKVTEHALVLLTLEGSEGMHAYHLTGATDAEARMLQNEIV